MVFGANIDGSEELKLFLVGEINAPHCFRGCFWTTERTEIPSKLENHFKINYCNQMNSLKDPKEISLLVSITAGSS